MKKPLPSGRAMLLRRPASFFVVKPYCLPTIFLVVVTLLFTILNSARAQTITITGTPGTEAYESAPYTGAIQATITNNDKLSFSAPVLPAWLTLNSGDASNARTINNTSIGQASGVAMDAAGNFYVTQNHGTTINKVDPQGNVTNFAQRSTGVNFGALVVGNYLYVSFYSGTRGIERFDLRKTNPSPEVVYATAGILSMTFREGYIYAASYSYGKIVRINESNFSATDFITGVSGPFGLGFDPAGNLLIALHHAKMVIHYNMATKARTTILSGLSNLLTDVKIDAQGYLYLSLWTGKIRKYSPDYSSYTEIGDTDIQCLSMTMTPEGVLIFADAVQGRVQALQTGVALTGTPALSDVGKHPVTISITNGSIVKTHSFEITVSDPNPPLPKIFTPANGALEFNKTTLSIEFSEKIKKGSGNIIVKNKLNDAVIETIAMNSSKVQVSDKKLSIELSQPLPYLTDIYVLIDAGAVKDLNENNFAGMSNSSGWFFQTEDQQLLPQTISLPATHSVVYGAAPYNLGATISSGLPITYQSSDISVAAISNGKITVKKAGSVIITASHPGNEEYLPVTATQQLIVEKAQIIITPENKTKVYGQTDPEFTFSVSGLVNNDKLNGKLSRISGENAGDFAITAGTVDAGENYQIEIKAAKISITPAALTITADAQSKVYGAPDPSLTYSVNGLRYNDKVTGKLNRESGENAGVYGILQGSLTAGTNYTLNFKAAEFHINKASVLIKANDLQKIYGTSDPALSFTVSGLLNNDKLSGSLVREQGNNVGEYEIKTGSIDAGANYLIDFTGASFSIKPALLTVKAKDQTITYGETEPEIVYSVEGLVNEDQLSGKPAREAGKDAGRYAITLGSLDAGANYTIAYTGAALLINQASLTVRANNLSKTYGQKDPDLTYAAEGLVSGDQFSGKLTRIAGKNVGKYEITAGNLSAGANYTMEFIGAEFEIKPANLLITADNKSRDEWKENPEFSFSYSGLADGDHAQDLISAPSATTSATFNSPAGKYDITVSGATSPNYTISYSKGILTVNTIDKKFVKAWRNGASLQIRIFTEVPQNASLMFTTSTGQVIRIQKESLRPGVNTILMPIGNLSPNIYILQVSADRFKEAIRVKF